MTAQAQYTLASVRFPCACLGSGPLSLGLLPGPGPASTLGPLPGTPPFPSPEGSFRLTLHGQCLGNRKHPCDGQALALGWCVAVRRFEMNDRVYPKPKGYRKDGHLSLALFLEASPELGRDNNEMPVTEHMAICKVHTRRLSALPHFISLSAL